MRSPSVPCVSSVTWELQIPELSVSLGLELTGRVLASEAGSLWFNCQLYVCTYKYLCGNARPWRAPFHHRSMWYSGLPQQVLLSMASSQSEVGKLFCCTKHSSTDAQNLNCLFVLNPVLKSDDVMRYRVWAANLLLASGSRPYPRPLSSHTAGGPSSDTGAQDSWRNLFQTSSVHSLGQRGPREAPVLLEKPNSVLSLKWSPV